LDVPSHYLAIASATLSLDLYYASQRGSNECPTSGSQQVVVDGVPWTTADATLRQFSVGLLLDGPTSFTIEQPEPGRVSRRVIDLRPGATLTSPATTMRIGFLGGRYSLTSDRTGPTRDTEEYLEVTLDFNGVRYVLAGRQIHAGPTGTCEEGEIRITDGNGALLARTFCSGGRTEFELLKPIPAFR
jgi:hypothetical protein